jgi:hypothetical protein
MARIPNFADIAFENAALPSPAEGSRPKVPMTTKAGV